MTSPEERTRTHFFLPHEMSPSLAALDAAARTGVMLEIPSLNFRMSIRAVVDMLSMPYLFALYGALHLEHAHLRTQPSPAPRKNLSNLEELRLSKQRSQDPEHRRLIGAAAQVGLGADWSANYETNASRVLKHVYNELTRYPTLEDTGPPAELLRHSTILLCSAIEVLVRRCYWYRAAKRPPYELPKVLKFLYPEFPNKNEVLKHFNLWILFQRRHLVAHCASIVNKDYLDKTGDSIRNGTRLVVSPTEMTTYLQSSVDFATDLIARCAKAGRRQRP